MRQGDNVHRSAFDLDEMLLPYHVFQQPRRKVLLDRQLSHGYQQLRLQQLDFSVQPFRTMCNLFAIRHPVATLGVLARKAATHRGDVDTLAKGGLIDPDLAVPAKQGLAGHPRERPSELALTLTRRLPDHEDAREIGHAGDHRAGHLRAAPAGPQFGLVIENGLKTWIHVATLPCKVVQRKDLNTMESLLGLGAAGLFLVALIWLLPVILILRSDKTNGAEKLLWVLLIFFFSWFSWLLYLLIAPVGEKSSTE